MRRCQQELVGKGNIFMYFNVSLKIPAGRLLPDFRIVEENSVWRSIEILELSVTAGPDKCPQTAQGENQ